MPWQWASKSQLGSEQATKELFKIWEAAGSCCPLPGQGEPWGCQGQPSVSPVFCVTTYQAAHDSAWGLRWWPALLPNPTMTWVCCHRAAKQKHFGGLPLIWEEFPWVVSNAQIGNLEDWQLEGVSCWIHLRMGMKKDRPNCWCLAIWWAGNQTLLDILYTGLL